MIILYKEEHLNCVNYSGNSRAAIVSRSFEKGSFFQEQRTVENELVFVLEGEVEFTFGPYKNSSVKTGQILFLPAASWFSCRAQKDSKVILMRLSPVIRLCDSCSVESVLNESNVDPNESRINPHLLEINTAVDVYLSALKLYVESGLLCHSFFTCKIKELFFLLRAYYRKEELARFFAPARTPDAEFSYSVIKSTHKYKTMKDMASAMNYTVSGFEKRFKRVFGVSGYKWMKEQKTRAILREIAQGDGTFKEMSEKFGFSTPSHFNDFCKQNLGKTPGEIRSSGVIGGNAKEKGVKS